MHKHASFNECIYGIMHTSQMKKIWFSFWKWQKRWTIINIQRYKLWCALSTAFYDLEKQNKGYQLFCDFVNNSERGKLVTLHNVRTVVKPDQIIRVL